MADLSLVVRGLIRDFCIDEHKEFIADIENDNYEFLKTPKIVVEFGLWLKAKHPNIYNPDETINLENLERIHCVGEG